ncbi:hypothetical protein JRO89_XS01G0292100 [Xanthoceras sorbifolium]|uniref:Ferrous iron transport protein A n=1 Tax=Xanthoceras sorbifolium TaxID=99658 RepID=A0ABQ8IN28_9ROSI|nr:hypothetical protein JRO89_XS01G0292100 [Xanthoceras sorbifolium]
MADNNLRITVESNPSDSRLSELNIKCWPKFTTLGLIANLKHMGLLSGEVPAQVRCRGDVLLVEREGESVPKRVVRLCGVWRWRSRHDPERTQLHLGCLRCR